MKTLDAITGVSLQRQEVFWDTAKVGYLQREVIMGSVGPSSHKCYVVLVGLKQLQINIGEQIFGTWVSVKEYFEYWY